MSLAVDKVLPILQNIEKEISNVRYLLSCPEGVRITAIWRDDFSYVEYWDSDMPPRILFYANEKVQEEIIHQHVFEAVGTIPPSYCGVQKIQIHTDIETFSEGINVAAKVFTIKFKEITNELINKIRERNDFKYYLSRVEEAQARAE